jgi:glycosyltransferase involved in cell wall biosynthesis
MRLHVVALPHHPVLAERSECAYTQKIRRFSTWMTELGHEVILYSVGDTDAQVTEHVRLDLGDALERGDGMSFKADDPAWQALNGEAQRAIEARLGDGPGEHLCLVGGLANAPLADAFPRLTVAEYGVGYEGVLPCSRRAFESYAWMHTVYGHLMGAGAADGRFYDTVIPNCYDACEFPAGSGEGGYLLYMGRLTARKGVAILDDLGKRGVPVVVAGSGEWRPEHCRHVGAVGPEERAQLMGGARALIAPTLYLEPFGGVVVEAQMCGTPVITTDWGGFTETVDEGVSGYRCRSLSDFLRAWDEVGDLDRQVIRRRAQERWSADSAKALYTAWFTRLETLWGEGWYALPAGRVP